ncbi:hypothetical protein [Occultella gossypii]|uniref:hypothetical protein n=1 Tax=Occultella gossypii TaxID=2800820 RepID=UPI001CC1152E|nr:hypothetical protein [Occultella gossypii]
MSVDLRPDVRPDSWRGAVGWEARDGALRVWRLLPGLVDRAFAPELVAMARQSAGVRLEVVAAAGRRDLDQVGPSHRLGACGPRPGHALDRLRILDHAVQRRSRAE